MTAADPVPLVVDTDVVTFSRLTFVLLRLFYLACDHRCILGAYVTGLPNAVSWFCIPLLLFAHLPTHAYCSDSYNSYRIAATSPIPPLAWLRSSPQRQHANVLPVGWFSRSLTTVTGVHALTSHKTVVHAFTG